IVNAGHVKVNTVWVDPCQAPHVPVNNKGHVLRICWVAGGQCRSACIASIRGAHKQNATLATTQHDGVCIQCTGDCAPIANVGSSPHQPPILHATGFDGMQVGVCDNQLVATDRHGGHLV